MRHTRDTLDFACAAPGIDHKQSIPFKSARGLPRRTREALFCIDVSLFEKALVKLTTPINSALVPFKLIQTLSRQPDIRIETFNCLLIVSEAACNCIEIRVIRHTAFFWTRSGKMLVIFAELRL